MSKSVFWLEIRGELESGDMEYEDAGEDIEKVYNIYYSLIEKYNKSNKENYIAIEIALYSKDKDDLTLFIKTFERHKF